MSDDTEAEGQSQPMRSDFPVNTERIAQTRQQMEADYFIKGEVRMQVPGLDGPACSNCGGLTQRTGSCSTCVECGTTTGCG